MSPVSAARNRVTPLGDIVAIDERGAWMGNRGLLHDAGGTRDVVRSHRGTAWLTCTLSFKGRRLPQWVPGRNTHLFFLDEAVSLAAGHRPCAECRRPAYNGYRAAWVAARGGGVPCARQLDEVLHAQRLPVGSTRPTTERPWADLPDGVFVRLDDGPAVVVGDTLTVWHHTYAARRNRPTRGTARVITPAASVAVLEAGYVAQIDPTAR